MDTKNLNIIYVDTRLLKPSEYNPRTWDKFQTEKLTESIKRFGLVDPLIVNAVKGRENILIGGHFRLEVAKKLGIKEVPVVYVSIADIEKEKELNLRLNRNTGQWDFELLKSFEVDMLLDIGFDDEDLSTIWDEQLSVEDDEFDTEDELSKIKDIKTKNGDIYRLGPHILACADATGSKFLDKIVDSSCIDMIYIDPPFNISLDYGNGIGTKKKYGATLTKDNKSYGDYRDFLIKALSNGLRKIKPDCHIFCYCEENYIGLLQEIYRSLGIDNKRVCLWIKNNANPTPQVAFNKAYEACVYGTMGNPYLASKVTNTTEVLNKEVGSGNRIIEDIYDIFNIWLVKRLATSKYEHPTEKPPSLHEKPLRRCTRISDTVLDLFGGSGSTLIACQQLKRKCIMTEIEPIFCDLIIKRYEKLTGEEAVYVN